MILAFDTYYFGEKAYTVCLEFESWESDSYINCYSEIKTGVKEYISGEFYKRELPCILSLLSKINLANVEYIIIDGFVYVDDEGKLGLGGHLSESINFAIPVIGLAKTDFASIKMKKFSIIRGESTKPLYISAIGLDLENAANLVKSMHGDFRIPTLLKKLDVLTKTGFESK